MGIILKKYRKKRNWIPAFAGMTRDLFFNRIELTKLCIQRCEDFVECGNDEETGEG
jgi:hypothetical protein